MPVECPDGDARAANAEAQMVGTGDVGDWLGQQMDTSSGVGELVCSLRSCALVEAAVGCLAASHLPAFVAPCSLRPFRRLLV